MSRMSLLWHVVAIATLVTGIPSILQPQGLAGAAVVGVVTRRSGDPVPQTRVVLRNASTGFTREQRAGFERPIRVRGRSARRTVRAPGVRPRARSCAVSRHVHAGARRPGHDRPGIFGTGGGGPADRSRSIRPARRRRWTDVLPCPVRSSTTFRSSTATLRDCSLPSRRRSTFAGSTP